MGKREKLRLLKIEERRTKLERNIYFISGMLFLSTVIINILNIIYYPYLLNGLVLEINIFMILSFSIQAWYVFRLFKFLFIFYFLFLLSF